MIWACEETVSSAFWRNTGVPGEFIGFLDERDERERGLLWG